MAREIENVIIIGSGPAGWTAALYASRANLSPLLFSGSEPGGQLMTTTDVENYPGFPEGVLGPDLVAIFRKQAERFGTRVVDDAVTEISLKEHPFRIVAAGAEYFARSVILATGASAKRLGLPTERTLYGKGVSACATCDGFFFKNKDVVVVGGGDSAMEESTFLTRFANRVTIVVRRDALKASKIMQERAMKNPKITFLWNSEVVEVLGEDVGRVTGVKIKNTKTGELSEQKTDGLFVAIGHEPNTALVAGQLELDVKGYVVTKPGRTETSLPGVFAGGDVQDPRYRQAVTAAGTGCAAALEAQWFLEHEG
ncbi:MAG: thioredoxin-disulfide reductase [Patescibacteria group bacterium]